MRAEHERQLIVWADEEYPREACGVMAGDHVYKIRNVAKDPVAFFAMDAEELSAIFEIHDDIDGVWHSHPNGRPHPSIADLDAHPDGKRLVIVIPGKVYDHGTYP